MSCSSCRSTAGPFTGALGAWVAISCWPLVLSASAQQERPTEIIAAQIRTQGFRCDDPTFAEHERRFSKSNEQIWVLHCANATYRIRLVPDMAAHMQRIN